MPIINKRAILLMLLISSTVSANDSVERKHVFPWEKQVGYSQVVKVGDTLYLSGITSSAETLESQMIDIYQKIEKILADYQLKTEHIVKEVIYTTDIEKLKAATATRKSFFKSGLYPVSSWLQVERLFNQNEMIEIEVIAQTPVKPKIPKLSEQG